MGGAPILENGPLFHLSAWPGVYGTFVQDEHSAFYDVVPLHTHFAGLSGVKDFYKAAETAFPDFKIDVWGEFDMPGCSIREVTISGTHKGDWCGVAGTGRPVKFHLAGFFLFGKGENSGKLVAERIYFDNETVMQQINRPIWKCHLCRSLSLKDDRWRLRLNHKETRSVSATHEWAVYAPSGKQH